MEEFIFKSLNFGFRFRIRYAMLGDRNKNNTLQHSSLNTNRSRLVIPLRIYNVLSSLTFFYLRSPLTVHRSGRSIETKITTL